MQKRNKSANGNMKSVGPSKALMEALKSEGLHVEWPDDIFVEIKGTFSTKSGSEHAVMLDFSYMKVTAQTSWRGTR